MKKLFLLIICCTICLGTFAQDKKVTISKATASSTEPGYDASKAIDGRTSTYWHSTWSNSATKFPVTFTITLPKATHVDFVRYIPRQDGNTNGNWEDVYVSYCPTTTGSDFTPVGSYALYGTSGVSDIWLTEKGVTCGQIKFTIESGSGRFVSAAEIEAYTVDNSYRDKFAQYFSDAIFSELKPEVTNSEGIEDATLKALIDNLLNDASSYRKFRVGEYEPYLSTETLVDLLKVSSSYNNYENPTGIYLKTGESCLVAVSGINTQYPVGLTIKNWVENESSSSYTLRNGLNQITASTEGNVFVKYYTDDFETAPNVKVHFINAPVQGYWDQATMTNADWVEMLKGRSKDDNTILITRSEHAQLAYPVSAWLKYCPTNVDSTMTLYQQVQWAERDILGLEKYGRQVKNRQLFYATTYGFMAAGGEGSYCNVNSLDAIMVPDAARFDFWGVGHEWGHNNQIYTGFKWSGCGETTNNIYASWAQIHFTGTPHNLRLEDEVTGIGEYSGMRGGRMQVYFEEAVRKGVPWQLQDGPDYHGITSEEKSIWGYDANGQYIGYVTTTSRNYDHFVKLVPFWQLNLWGTLAGKCPDIIPMVIESIRSTKNYSSYHGTNGKKQINWMKLACDSAKIDLLPFFEKAGMLRPINAYIEDYNAGWNIITEEMIAELKSYVKEQGYPAFTEEINYINAHNYHIYRDELKLDVPKELNEGCKVSGGKVTVQHSVVKHAVAFETYNASGELLRITMYGLGSDNNHSYTQVLYPKSSNTALSAAYIMAVGYDGTRIKIYEEGGLRDEFLSLFEQAKRYTKRTDTTGKKVGFVTPEHMEEYAALISRIDSLMQHIDARERPYSTWTEELREGIAALLVHCSPLQPNNVYTLSTSSHGDQYMGINSNGLTTHAYTKETRPLSLMWRVIETESEGVYHLQHLTTGRYLTSMPNGLQAKAESTDIADAVALTIELVAPGEFYVQSLDNALIRLYDNGASVCAGNQVADNARWLISLEESTPDADLLSLPQTSTDEQLSIYRLIRTDNGDYAYSSTARRSAGRIATNIYADDEDFAYWFYFKQGSQEGMYTIHNYKTGKAITRGGSNELFANKDEEAMEFAIVPDERGRGLQIAAAEGSWYMLPGTTELLELSDAQCTTWKLQHACTFNPSREPLASLVISHSEAALTVGGWLTLSVETAPIYATDHTVTWSSSDASVATVDETGRVEAIAVGEAFITATANDGSGLTAACRVTVTEDNTSISVQTDARPRVESRGSQVIVSGIAVGTEVALYSITGRLLASATANSNVAAFEVGLPQGGMVIVVIAGRCYKTILNK